MVALLLLLVDWLELMVVVQTFGILHFGCCKIGFHFEWQNDDEFRRIRPFGPSSFSCTAAAASQNKRTDRHRICEITPQLNNIVIMKETVAAMKRR